MVKDMVAKSPDSDAVVDWVGVATGVTVSVLFSVNDVVGSIETDCEGVVERLPVRRS